MVIHWANQKLRGVRGFCGIKKPPRSDADPNKVTCKKCLEAMHLHGHVMEGLVSLPLARPTLVKRHKVRHIAICPDEGPLIICTCGWKCLPGISFWIAAIRYTEHRLDCLEG